MVLVVLSRWCVRRPELLTREDDRDRGRRAHRKRQRSGDALDGAPTSPTTGPLAIGNLMVALLIGRVPIFH